MDNQTKRDPVAELDEAFSHLNNVHRPSILYFRKLIVQYWPVVSREIHELRRRTATLSTKEKPNETSSQVQSIEKHG